MKDSFTSAKGIGTGKRPASATNWGAD